jgi:hypothetical protein
MSDEVKLKVQIGERVSKEMSSVSWREQDIAINKPTIILLPGGEATNPRIANGYAKLLYRTLGIKDNLNEIGSGAEFQVITAFYNTSQSASQLYDDFVYDEISRVKSDVFYIPKYVDEFCRKNLDVLVVSPESKKRYSFQEVVNKLSNLRIVGHSFGAVTSVCINRWLNKRMEELGYSKTESEVALKQGFVITLGSPLIGAKTGFSCTEIVNLRDDQIARYSAKELVGLTEDSGFKPFYGNLKDRPDVRFVKTSDRTKAYIVTSHVPFEGRVFGFEGEKIYPGNQHMFGSYLARDIDVRTRESFMPIAVTKLLRAAICHSTQLVNGNNVGLLPSPGLLIHGDNTNLFSKVAGGTNLCSDIFANTPLTHVLSASSISIPSKGGRA